VAQAPADVDVAKESYETLLSLSSSENAVGQRLQAVQDLNDALVQIQKVLAAKPGDTNVKVELANVESRIGQMQLDARDAGGAIPHLTHASTLLQELSAADPGNAVFRRGRSIVEAQWAAALRGSGQLQEGVAHNQEALRIAEALRQSSPKSTQYGIDVAVSERKLSEGLLATGDAANALHHAELAMVILCAESAASSNTNTLSNCGRSEVAAANASMALHHAAAAEATLRKAETIAAALCQKDPTNAIFRSDLARTQAALGVALFQVDDRDSAKAMYAQALQNWSVLRAAKSISAEDSYRSDMTHADLLTHQG
jgi:tetratricopeptide (TPR) repeat protein